MPHLNPIRLDDDTTIYIEAADVPQVVTNNAEPGSELQPKNADFFAQTIAAELEEPESSTVGRNTVDFGEVEKLIQTSAKRTIQAFQDAALANVDKVTLEFGVNISGSAGVPYISQGEVGSSFKITVECSFPQRSNQESAA